MNKLWIEDSHVAAATSRKFARSDGKVTKIKYLDMIGLFETCWMIYGLETHNEYGYPG